MSNYVTLENGRLHYLKMGKGKRLLFCFHGYGNSASLFYSFERYLTNDFTIISIDLPHHGKSEWRKSTLLRRKDLVQFITTLLQEYKTDKFSLAGYSMGGRACLTIAEMMPEKIDRMLLIASDGLVFNPLYFAVTKTLVGRKIFRSFLTEPKRYMKFIDWMRNKKWIDESRYKFAMYYLGSETDRSFLLHVWNDMSLIIPNMKKLRAAIKAHKMPVYIFMGSYDRVIPVKHAKRFKEGLQSVRLFIVAKGHRVFDNETLPQMANCLISGKC